MLIRSTLLFAALTLLTGLSFAGDKDSGAAPETPKPFAIWSGGCSRSLQQVGAFADLQSALNAAEPMAEGKGSVFVLQNGDWSDALNAFRGLRSGAEVKTLRHTIYSRACRRSGWLPVTEEKAAPSPPAAEPQPESDKTGSVRIVAKSLSVFEVVR